MTTYSTLFKQSLPTLEEHGIDVDRLMLATGLSERDTVAFIYHTVFPMLMMDVESLYKKAAETLKEMSEGVTPPEPINVVQDRDTTRRYAPGAWKAYYDEIDAKLANRTGNPLTKYTTALNRLLAILMKGPDTVPLAYTFVLTHLKGLRKEGAMGLLAYERDRTLVDVVVRLGNADNRVGIQVSGGKGEPGPDGFPIYKTGGDHIAMEPGTPEYANAMAYTIESLTQQGFKPTNDPMIFVDPTGCRAKIYDMMLKPNPPHYGYMLRYVTVR